jgi:hypothetical protein
VISGRLSFFFAGDVVVVLLWFVVVLSVCGNDLVCFWGAILKTILRVPGISVVDCVWKGQ